jgi:putative ABC transport system permease protein
MVSAVAAVSILVSIYNSVVARRREIAILRALGATRSKVLAVITAEATLLGLVGGVLGVALGYLVATVATGLIDPRLVGDVEGITLGAVEFYYLIGVVIGSALAGLVPALKAYRVSVADNLSSAE